jgi:hypothetical protein
VARDDQARTRASALRLALAALTSICGCNTPLDLGWNDAGAPYDADCRPGTYTGMFACTPADASFIQPSSQGSIAVTLVPIGVQTLALPPDASLMIGGSGTTATSMLSGTLDCSTRELRGRLGPVQFSSASFYGSILGNGTLSAVYDPDASPPALIDGVIDGPPSLAATCTWAAHLQ